MDTPYPEHPDDKRRATLRRAAASLTETAGRALVFVGLAEGIAIYGLIVAIMILGYLQ